MATAVSSVEISVSWEEVPQADQNGIVIAYEVLFEPQVTFDGALMEEVINVTNMSVLLNDLHPFVNYSISVRAFTIVGGGPCATVIALTLEDSRLITCQCVNFFLKSFSLKKVLLVLQQISQLSYCLLLPSWFPGRRSLHLI